MRGARQTRARTALLDDVERRVHHVVQLRGGVRVRLRGVGRALERADVQRVVLLADHGDRRHDHAGQRPRFGWAPRAPAGLSRRRLHAAARERVRPSRFFALYGCMPL